MMARMLGTGLVSILRVVKPGLRTARGSVLACQRRRSTIQCEDSYWTRTVCIFTNDSLSCR
jgi:hypothetical protein